MKYVLYSVKKNPLTFSIRSKIEDILKKSGFTYDEQKPDYIIVIGGDGSFLRAVNKYQYLIDSAIFIGFKSGHLGYYCNYEFHDVDKLIDIINNNHITKLSLIKGIINSTDEIYALNEITISNPPLIGVYDVYVDNVLLENYHGNGLLVCTTTGSTGYNKSLNGAIIDSKLPTLELTEIAPLNSNVYHSIRDSIIFSPDRKIELINKKRSRALITYDANTISLKNFEKIEICLSKKHILTLTNEKDLFVSKIRKTFPI